MQWMKRSTQRRLMQFGFYASAIGLIWYAALFKQTLFTPVFGTVLGLLCVCAGFISSGDKQPSDSTARRRVKDRDDDEANDQDDQDDSGIDPFVRKVRREVRRVAREHVDRTRLASIRGRLQRHLPAPVLGSHRGDCGVGWRRCVDQRRGLREQPAS